MSSKDKNTRKGYTEKRDDVLKENEDLRRMVDGALRQAGEVRRESCASAINRGSGGSGND